MHDNGKKSVQASISSPGVQELGGPFDITVVGAGLVGSAIAWLLGREGRKVQLIDAGTFAGEASGAGAGMLAPGGEYKEASRDAHFAIESLAMYPTFVHQLESESGLPIDFRNCGAIELALDPESWAALRQQAEAQRRFGIAVDSICPSATGLLIPGLETKRLTGALLYPKDCCVDPGHLLRALRIACERRSVTILEGFAVEGIELQGDRVCLQMGHHRVVSRHAVLAAGAWSSGVRITRSGNIVEIPRGVPVKGHLLGYSLPPTSLRPIVRHRHYYLVQRKDGFTVAGATSELCGFDRTLNPNQAHDIQEGVSLLYAPLRSLEPTRVWAGFRPGVEASEPVIRRLMGTNLWLAYGHYRNGILLMPATANLVTAEILNNVKHPVRSAPAGLAKTLGI